ncbi:MAG: hypothetical protein R3F61_15635 [Myxococcota bacterium]
MRWAVGGLAAVLPLAAVAGLHAWLGTPPSPPHQYVLDRPTVAIVGGRAEHCLPRAWGELPEDHVVNLARRDTDWRALVAQVRFALDVSPPAVLVAAVDPEQLLYERDGTPDPDRLRRSRYAVGGVAARVYGVLDRWLSVPRLFERPAITRYDPASWGADMGTHWADPDGLRAVRSVLHEARAQGIDVHAVVLPLPATALESWRAGPRGDQLDVILQSLEAHDLTGLPGGYFPDGLGCARLTGRAVLEELVPP